MGSGRRLVSPSSIRLLKSCNGNHVFSDVSRLAENNSAFDIALSQQPGVETASTAYGLQFASATRFPGGYPSASSQSLSFPYPVGNYDVANEYNNKCYAPSTQSNNFAQGLLAADIPSRYVAGSLDVPNALRYDANASLSAQPHAFSTGALNLTNPTYAEYSGVAPATQYCSGPSNDIERPFATDGASIGSNDFATASVNYINGQFKANNPIPMPVSNNPILPLGIGLMTEDPIPLPPNMYPTGRAPANNPVPMPTSNNHILPMEMGLMTEGPNPLSPNNYIAGRALTSKPHPVPTSNSTLIPVDIRPPVPQRALCKKCDRTFGRQSDLERHAKKHGPKNIKCQVQGCKYRTYRNDKLGEHMIRRHAAGAGGGHSN